MRRLFILTWALFVPLSALHAQQSDDKFPTEDQINLLVSQSERALDSYENTLQLEAQLVGGPESVVKDRDVLTAGRKVIASIKANPSKMFNSPMGFLLVTNLDDASRNAAVCMGQGGMQASTAAIDGKAALSESDLRTSQACLDTSMLLYTVSESAFNLYAEYLAEQYKLTQQASDALQNCVRLLKESAEKK